MPSKQFRKSTCVLYPFVPVHTRIAETLKEEKGMRLMAVFVFRFFLAFFLILPSGARAGR